MIAAGSLAVLIVLLALGLVALLRPSTCQKDMACKPGDARTPGGTQEPSKEPSKEPSNEPSKEPSKEPSREQGAGPAPLSFPYTVIKPSLPSFEQDVPYI